MAPLFSPSGLIYRYVLESPDRSPEELKVIQDWVLFRRYKSIPGIADDSGLGGTTRQYQVVLDPNALNTYHVASPTSSPRSATTTRTRAAGSTSSAASSTTCAGSAG